MSAGAGRVPSGYKLGAVGLGHWTRRLYRVLEKQTHGRVSLWKVAALRPYEERRADLAQLSIPPERYYRGSRPEEPLPPEFFEGLDVVQIASWNQYHAAQTLRTLEFGKIAVTEKTFAPDRAAFDSVVDYVKSRGHQSRVTLDLHYLGKGPTLALPDLLARFAERYGRVERVVGTFFEEEREEDARRPWLFRPESGGIKLDWIHPEEVLAVKAGADFRGVEGVEHFAVQPAYDPRNPTGVAVTYRIGGSRFAAGATATVRVGKGFPEGSVCKKLRFRFERDALLELRYIDSEREFVTEERGSWLLRERDGREAVQELRGGPVSFDFLVQDIVGMAQGRPSKLTLADIERIFRPFWMFQEASRGLRLLGGEAVERFREEGLALRPAG